MERYDDEKCLKLNYLSNGIFQSIGNLIRFILPNDVIMTSPGGVEILDTDSKLNLLMPKKDMCKICIFIHKMKNFSHNDSTITGGKQSSSPPIVRKPLQLTLL